MRDGILVFGASSSTGRVLLQALSGTVWAVSRQADSTRPAERRPHWLRGSLPELTLPPDCRPAQIASLGPLPDFAAWLQRQPWRPQRVVALSSASAVHKARSAAEAERTLAARLIEAERQLHTLARQDGFAGIVLRPTLIWGGGHCALSRLAHLARRWRWVPRPWPVGGARTPLHHRDLAAAVGALLSRPHTPSAGEALLLGGAHTLAIGDLVRAVVRSVGARCLRLPTAILSGGQALARRAGLAFGEGLFGRWPQDQSVDSAAVWSHLGLAPRGFDPQPADWEDRQ